MKAGSSLAMPKSAFLICFLVCSNFILSGKTAQQCPKNPLSPTNSVSGMVIGAIVGAEKVVNGVFSYFWYLGENSINQVIGLSAGLEGQISSITISIHDFAAGFLNSIGGQIKSIYNSSTGSIRFLFDSIIKAENSAQTFVYKQVENVADKVVSGQFTGEVTAVIKNPFSSLAIGLKKAKGAVFKLSTKIDNGLKSIVYKVETSGVPDDIKQILGSPVRGVKEFIKDTQSVIQTVKNETSEKIAGYSSEFKNGNMIDKVVAISSLPVGIMSELWSFTLKEADAARKSVSVSVKDVVQPFLGQILTERLGAIVNLPLDITQGFYESTKNFFCQIKGIIARVTGAGSVNVQINMIVKHPVFVIQNAWNVTKQDLRAFSKALIGAELTQKLGNALSSPGQALSSLMSSVTGSNFWALLNKPIVYLEGIWWELKMTLSGISQGFIGPKWTAKISEVLNAPLKSISDFSASITGGGSIGTQIKTVLTNPLQIIKHSWNVLKAEVEGFITSITGGGSLSTQLSTVFTKPLTLAKNIWYTTKEITKGISTSLVGESLTDTLGKTITSPLATLSNITASVTGGGSLSVQLKTVLTDPLLIIQNLWAETKTITKYISRTLFGGSVTNKLSQVFGSPLEKLSNVTASITGGGSLSTQIKTVLSEPFLVIKTIWNKSKNAVESSTKALLGGDLGTKLSQLFSSPLSTLSSFFGSLKSKLSGLFHGFTASFNFSAGGAGQIIAALKSFFQAPIDIFEGTFKGIQNAMKSLMNSIKGFYASLLGAGSSIKADVNIGEYKTNGQFNFGADGKGNSQSDGKAGAKWGGSFRFGGSTDGKYERSRRSLMK